MEAGTAREQDPPALAEYSLPGDPTQLGISESPGDLPRSPRVPGRPRNIAVSCDPSARDSKHCSLDFLEVTQPAAPVSHTGAQVYSSGRGRSARTRALPLRAVSEPMLLLQRFEARRKMTEKGRLVNDPVSLQRRSPFMDFQDRLHNVVDVTLRIYAPRDRQTDQFHGCRDFLARVGVLPPEHHGPDLHRTNSGRVIELARE